MHRSQLLAALAALALVSSFARAESIAVGQVADAEEQLHKVGDPAFPSPPDEAALRAAIPVGKAALLGDKGYFLNDGFLYWTRLGSGVTNVVKVHCTFLYDAYARAADVRFRQILAFREALFLLDDNDTLMIRSPRRPDRFIALEVGVKTAVASERHLFVLNNKGAVKVYAGDRAGKSDKSGQKHSRSSHRGFETTPLEDATRLRLSEGSKVLATFKDGREMNVYDLLEL